MVDLLFMQEVLEIILFIIFWLIFKMHNLIKHKKDFYKEEHSKVLKILFSLGVTALYIMSILERDNCPFLNKYSDIKEYKKEDASPLAVTSRDNAN